MKEITECYLCRNTAFVERPGKVRDRNDLKVLQCQQCQLVFLSSFDHISDGFYEDSGMHNGTPDLESWFKETAWDDDRRFAYMKEMLPGRSLLDFGCGSGGFLIRSRELLVDAHGLEPEISLADHFKKHGLYVRASLADLAEIKRSPYDFITMFHVLEHLPDPRAVLRDLAGHIGSGGEIIIEVPSADDALLTLYKSKSFSEFTYWSCHLFLFSIPTLSELFFQAGLKVNYIRPIQRYPLANHLYWLAEGKPGGHKQWHFLDSPELRAAYERQLAEIGKCDTILASVSNY